MLKSRFPQIIATLNPKVDAALRVGVEGMKGSAQQRVHVLSGDLRDATHVERLGLNRYAVVAGDEDVFWGHLEEFGTSHSSPHPFLVPAFEEQKDTVVHGVVAALRGL